MPELKTILADRYDRVAVGPIGAFDVHTLVMQFAKASVADRIAREWRGGYYVAVRDSNRKNNATLSPADLKLIYVSRWSSPKAAEQFFDVYAHSVPRRYSGAKLESDAHASAEQHSTWQTSEGAVMMQRVDNAIVICESVPPETAARIRDAALAALRNNESTRAAAQP
jgi:hypothetical protein